MRLFIVISSQVVFRVDGNVTDHVSIVLVIAQSENTLNTFFSQTSPCLVQTLMEPSF